MTTAHRPTWAPAVGGEEQGGNRLFVPSRAYSAKDQPSHTKLKFRWDTAKGCQSQKQPRRVACMKITGCTSWRNHRIVATSE